MSNHPVLIQERINDYRMILIYRWRLIALVTVALFGALFAVVLLLPNVYEATTTIVDYPRKVPERYVPSAVVDDPSNRLNLLQQEVLSYTRLMEIIDKFGLYNKVLRERGQNAAIQLMREHIKIQTMHASSSGASSFTLTYSGSDPKIVAAVVNELSNGFILKNLANREQQVRGTSNFLKQELDSARADLESLEAHLRAYRVSHLGEMPEQMAANLQAIGQLQAQYQATSDKMAQLEEEKILIESAPQSNPVARSSPAPSPASVLRNELRQEQLHRAAILAHDTQIHPDVIESTAKIAELEKQIASLTSDVPKPASVSPVKTRLDVIDQERARLSAEQAEIRTRLESYQAKVDAMPLRQEQLSSLTRDYETARDRYRSLLEKTYSADMASELEAKQDADRFEILDPAIPPDHPISPNRPLLWGVSALLALMSGFMAATGKEQMDTSIKSEAELLGILSRDLELVGIISTISPVRDHPESRLLATR